MVQSADNPILWIPDELIGYNAVCGALETKTSRYEANASMPLGGRPGIAFLQGTLMLVTLLSGRLVVVIPAGVAATGLALYFWIFSLRNASAHRSLKIQSGFTSLLSLAAFLIRVVYLLGLAK
jgi:hypothetical protein